MAQRDGALVILATDPRVDGLAAHSCTRARRLIDEAERLRTRRERANRRRFSRLLRGRGGIEVTMTLTDEVMRVAAPRSASSILRRAAKLSTRAGVGVIDAVGLRTIAAASRVAPQWALHVVHARVRSVSRDMILASEITPLRRWIEARTREAIHLNVNVLGEAVLGDREAIERFDRIIEMMRRDEVNYVSVKLSSLVSQIVTVDHQGSLSRVNERLRLLYREARDSGVFINLDMEEYRDLKLTEDAFCTVLAEPEFETLEAGIVLQAYLPESHQAYARLVVWARQRYERAGGTIKIRLVKGANLAMERAEAQLHGWTSAPYGSKAEVDASYARLLDVALRPEHCEFVRVGVASHNLFDLSWALDVSGARGVLDKLDVEMLEGMANAEALAIARSGQRVVLYAPVTRRDDFAAAVAYLVRRLDENTSSDNYLKAAFFIARDARVFDDQRQRFLVSIEQRHSVSVASIRHGARRPAPRHSFENAADGDPTDPTYVHGVEVALTRCLSSAPPQIPVVVGGHEILDGDLEGGADPSDGGRQWYRYAVATPTLVEAAVQSARSAASSWSRLGWGRRRELLLRVAEVMESHRASTIAVMMRDGGKTVAEADPEVSEGIDFARFYAENAHDRDGSTPLGVVLVVPPWNFPYAIPAGGVCAALAAGNVVLLKPAPETVATAWELARHFWEAGIPRDVVQFVPTRDDDCGRRLVTHEGIDGVVLTGSFQTAQLFTSWKPNITLLAETSGKNAILVSAHADVDLAVKDLVQSGFGHAGQKCSAASLAIVERSVYERSKFIAQLTDAVETLRVGPSYDFATAVGPIIRPAEAPLARALHQLDPGESWLIAPQCLDEAGLLWRPGVKTGVTPGSWSHQNEWFGPVLGVMVAPDVATALTWQNSVPFGLTAGLHSLDVGECEWWIDHVEAGNLYVNRGITGAVVNRQPFGGWKASSVGPAAKAGGRNYVDSLRRWPNLVSCDDAVRQLEEWWRDYGSRSRDEAGLSVEANLQRYRRPLGPIVVRVDSSFDAHSQRFVRRVAEITGTSIQLSANGPFEGMPQIVLEGADRLVERSATLSQVRWLSAENPPVEPLLQRGISIDLRPLAQSGAVEGPRWLNEQSVAITNHRYGNVKGGAKPVCRGLGQLDEG